MDRIRACARRIKATETQGALHGRCITPLTFLAPFWDKYKMHLRCILTEGTVRWWRAIRTRPKRSQVEETETKSVTMALLAVRHWRRMKWSKTNHCGKPVFIVRAELVLLRHERGGRRSSNSHSQNCCASSPLLSLSLQFFCLDPSIQPPHTLLSPPISSTCPPPPTSLEFFLVSFISENSRPFMQSFHFFPPLPSIPFVCS